MIVVYYMIYYYCVINYSYKYIVILYILLYITLSLRTTHTEYFLHKNTQDDIKIIYYILIIK